MRALLVLLSLAIPIVAAGCSGKSASTAAAVAPGQKLPPEVESDPASATRHYQKEQGTSPRQQPRTAE